MPMSSSFVIVTRAGLDYTRAAFGPCTAPGAPADTCKVVYTADLAGDATGLDSELESFHGTQVAGVIAGNVDLVFDLAQTPGAFATH